MCLGFFFNIAWLDGDHTLLLELFSSIFEIQNEGKGSDILLYPDFLTKYAEEGEWLPQYLGHF